MNGRAYAWSQKDVAEREPLEVWTEIKIIVNYLITKLLNYNLKTYLMGSDSDGTKYSK